MRTKLSKNQSGFAHLTLILAGVVVIAVLAFVGYRTYQASRTVSYEGKLVKQPCSSSESNCTNYALKTSSPKTYGLVLNSAPSIPAGSEVAVTGTPSTSTSGQSTIKVITITPTTTATTTTPSASSTSTGTPSTTKYLDITQLGVQLPLTSSISDLRYYWDSSNNSAGLQSFTLIYDMDTDNSQNQSSSCSSYMVDTNYKAYPTAEYLVAIITKSENSLGTPSKSVIVNGETYYLYSPTGYGCADPSGVFASQLYSYTNAVISSFASASQ